MLSRRTLHSVIYTVWARWLKQNAGLYQLLTKLALYATISLFCMAETFRNSVTTFRNGYDHITSVNGVGPLCLN